MAWWRGSGAAAVAGPPPGGRGLPAPPGRPSAPPDLLEVLLDHVQGFIPKEPGKSTQTPPYPGPPGTSERMPRRRGPNIHCSKPPVPTCKNHRSQYWARESFPGHYGRGGGVGSGLQITV